MRAGWGQDANSEPSDGSSRPRQGSAGALVPGR
jgi:hypothetical protein